MLYFPGYDYSPSAQACFKSCLQTHSLSWLLNIHFLILKDFVPFETQEVGGCLDLQNTQMTPLFLCFVVVLRRKICCAREAAAAWTDTA